MKEFNTTGLCNPKKHYMVDISDKLENIKKLVEKEKYFIINRPRQYGKTTTLVALENNLKDEYLVISISFEGTDINGFSTPQNFCKLFVELVSENLDYVDEKLSTLFVSISKDVNSLTNLSRAISRFIKEIDKEVILIIDEVDKSSDNQMFLDFLGMLRNKYLERERGRGVTFKSVILAGVYDIKNLKLKLRPDEERKYNSPWNIAVPFNVDMSLSEKGIEGMLEAYKNDKKIELDTKKASKFIYFYTSGYPFLVSRICQIIDENLGASWNEENMIRAVKLLLLENNTLFDDLVKNIENNKELKEYMFNLIMNGANTTYNIYDQVISITNIFGYCVQSEGKTKISNRIFEQFLYNYFSAILERTTNVKEYNNKTDFIEGNGLNIEKIMLRFQQFMKEQYSPLDSKFVEREGRLLFLAFIRPIINGVGFDFKEVQISEEKRLDIVITYNNHKYIIELKIWRGDNYHQKGLKQLANYLDINEQDKGYLLVFNFNKNKEYKKEEVIIDNKKITIVFV